MMGAMDLRTARRGTSTSAAAVLAGVLALGACAGSPSPAPASAPPSQTPSATPAPTTTPRATPSASAQPPVVLASGAVAFDVVPPGPGTATGAPARVDPADDGAAVLSVSPGENPLTLVLTTPGALTANADGTVTVRDPAGKAVGGLSAPVPRASLTVSGPTRAELAAAHRDGDASAGAAEPGGAVTTTLGTAALRNATGGDREGGLSLAVDPTAWARTAGVAGSDVLWAAVVTAEPDADLPGMRDQLVCHALGAPDKATWNLEPWRPDVGLVAVLAARCNPT